MPVIELQILIDAPRERVFDLSRSIDAHQDSAEGTDERAVAGVTSGLLGLGEDVTWEARHLGVGFSVMEMQGYNKSFIELVQMVMPVVDPRLLLGVAIYFPLLNKMRDNIVALGLPEERLYEVIRKFEKIGGRTPDGRRNPWFQLIRRHGRWMVNRRNRLYHVPVDFAVRLTGYIPRQALPPVPTWVRELTWHPAA